MIRSLLLAAMLATSLPAIVQAQTCETQPQFSTHRTAHGSVRAQSTAVLRGEWRQAIHFGQEVAASGTSPRHRTAALSNLCQAYAAVDDLPAALAACEAALELDPNSWHALNNRGAVHWLAGRSDAARTDFLAAGTRAGMEADVAANLALGNCS